MVLKKLSRSVAAVATAAMMVSPMMAMAAPSPVVPTVDKLVEQGKATATFDEKTGALTSLTVVGNEDDGVLAVEIDNTVVFLVIKGGKWDTSFTSITGEKGKEVVTPVTLDGEDFIAEDGVVLTTVNGIVTDSQGAYFVAAGRIVKDDTVAEYQGEWFAIKGGKVDATVTGPKTFKDAKGNDVTGLFAAGRMIIEFSGFTDDGSKTYYVDEGVIRTDLTGGPITAKNGAGETVTAYIENGVVVK